MTVEQKEALPVKQECKDHKQITNQWICLVVMMLDSCRSLLIQRLHIVYRIAQNIFVFSPIKGTEKLFHVILSVVYTLVGPILRVESLVLDNCLDNSQQYHRVGPILRCRVNFNIYLLEHKAQKSGIINFPNNRGLSVVLLSFTVLLFIDLKERL